MSSLYEVIRSIKRGTRARLSCPRCGKPVIKSKGPLEGWILPPRYLCMRCGYSGFVVLEGGPEILADS